METPQNLRPVLRRDPVAQRAAGFTLVEVVITIAIVAILLVVGNSSFSYITNSNRVAAEVNGLLGDMQLARMEAIKDGLPVIICSSTSGTACTGANNWHSGWIVFADLNLNGAFDAATETILRRQPAFTNLDTLRPNNVTPIVTFNREGFAQGVVAGTYFSLHDSTTNPNWTRCLSVNRSGMTFALKYGTYNGVTCT